MKNDVDILQRGGHSRAITDVALDELGVLDSPTAGLPSLWVFGSRLSRMRTRPAFPHEQINEVRADQARAAGHERAFAMVVTSSFRIVA